MNRTAPSKERLTVEAELAAAAEPLSSSELASRTGLTLACVRLHLTNLVNRDLAHNVNPGQRRNARYAPGMATAPSKATACVAAPRTAPGGEHYDGRELRPYTGRPGALDAFTLPSLQAGTAVPRRAPVLLGSTKLERVL